MAMRSQCLHCPLAEHERKYRILKYLQNGTSEKPTVVTAEKVCGCQNGGSNIFAIKCYPTSLQVRNGNKTYLLREVLALKRARSENVTALHEVFVTRTHICVVMEYAPGDTLLNHIIQTETGFDEREARYCFVETLKGMRDLLKQGLVHRDIKPTNILYDRAKGSLKITDLGFAKRISDGCVTLLGTYFFMSPEQFNLSKNHKDNDPIDGEKSDVWSLGVMLYFMLFNDYPFHPKSEDLDGESVLTHMRKVMTTQELPTSRFKTISPGCVDALKRMLEKDPQKRITIDGLTKLPWIKDAFLPSKQFPEYAPTPNKCSQTESQLTTLINEAVFKSTVDDTRINYGIHRSY